MLDLTLRLYYPAKRFLPRRLQLALRRPLVAYKLRKHAALWPINPATVTPPPGWTGWPEGKRFALVLTHDVESQRGVDRVLRLADLEERLGFRSSFNFVAEDYSVSSSLREELDRRGFEVGLHGLTHDGSLYHSRREFLRQATRINEILREWNVVGFRSPCMYHNLEWLHDLDIEYDASTFDTDPFEPQPDALGTIFPVHIASEDGGRGYVELPYTVPQDLHVFVLMQERSAALWHRKLDWLTEQGGLALVSSHPDYMGFEDHAQGCDEYPVERYRDFLEHVKETYCGTYWHILPRQLARFWKHHYASEPAHVSPFSIASQQHSSSSKPTRQDSPSFKSTRQDSRSCKSAREDSPFPEATHQHCSFPEATHQHSPFLKGGSRGISSNPHTEPIASSTAPGLRKPLRACMVAYTFYETDGRVKRYAESLVRRGDEVDVIALRRDNQDERELDNGATVFRIQKRVVNETGKLSYFVRILSFLFRSSWLLARKHLQKPYDLIHIHNVPDYEVFAALVPKLGGAKIILDIHDILPEFYASKFDSAGTSFAYRALTLIERLSCAFADHVIISNDLWREKLTTRSVPASKCLTLINYPDLRVFTRRQHGESPGERFIMIYPGTLNHHQGLDVAVRAFARIKDELPKAEFHIYGEGPSKESLMDLVSNLGLGKRVFFHGVVPLGEIAGIMSKADLGIVPKRANSFGNEAFSTKILEFLALGVPVVASDTRIDRYYFNDSVIRFFRSEDESALADAIRSLLRDDHQRRNLAAKGLEFARMRSWEAKQKLYLDLVDRLVGTAGETE